ncbi:MAG: hypothetical protein SFW66_06165 [Gammaproteobacteria bacterium]|nr:hypothetical protein [Gammaproteobacteria bacterium]
MRANPVTLQDRRFPSEKDLIVFQCIQDMIAGRATMSDLLQCIRKNPNAINVTLSITNITGPELYHIEPEFTRTLKAHGIAPLHYAFLTGRIDAFSLLLAEGADYNTPFNFQCTSLEGWGAKNEDTFTEGTLLELFTTDGCGNFFRNEFCSQQFRVALFFALFLRKDLNALDMLFHALKQNQDIVKRTPSSSFFTVKTELWQLDRLCSFILSPKKIYNSINILSPSYHQFIDDFINEMRQLKKDAWNQAGLFSSFTKEAAEKFIFHVLNILITPIDDLHLKIDSNLNDNQCHELQIQDLLNSYRNYDKDQQKIHYKKMFSSEINRACYWIFKDEDSVSSKEKSETIWSCARDLATKNDNENYREALAEFIAANVDSESQDVYKKLYANNEKTFRR